MSDIHALVAPYALDAVTELDRRRFDAHLPECESCTNQLAGFAATAAGLGASQAMTPPAHLRAQILSTVAALPQDRAFAQKDSRRTWRRLLPAAAVAAALVIPVAGTATYMADRPGVSADPAANTSAVSSVLAAPDAATRSEAVAGGGNVRVVTSRARGAAVVAADHLPALASGKTYQIWTLASGGATSRGTFATSTIVAAHRLASADRVAVTVEPDGGSPRPTSLPIAVLKL